MHDRELERVARAMPREPEPERAAGEANAVLAAEWRELAKSKSATARERAELGISTERRAELTAIRAERESERERAEQERADSWAKLSSKSAAVMYAALLAKSKSEAREWAADRGFMVITPIALAAIHNAAEHVGASDYPTVGAGEIESDAVARFAALVGRPIEQERREQYLSNASRASATAYRVARHAGADSYGSGVGRPRMPKLDIERLVRATRVLHRESRESELVPRELTAAESKRLRRQYGYERAEGSIYGARINAFGASPAVYGEPHALQSQSDESAIDSSRHSALGVPELHAPSLLKLSLSWAIERRDSKRGEQATRDVSVLALAVDTLARTRRRSGEREHAKLSLSAIGMALGIHRGTAKRALLRGLAKLDRAMPYRAASTAGRAWRVEPIEPRYAAERAEPSAELAKLYAWLSSAEPEPRVAKRETAAERDAKRIERAEWLRNEWWLATRTPSQRAERTRLGMLADPAASKRASAERLAAHAEQEREHARALDMDTRMLHSIELVAWRAPRPSEPRVHRFALQGEVISSSPGRSDITRSASRVEPASAAELAKLYAAWESREHGEPSYRARERRAEQESA